MEQLRLTIETGAEIGVQIGYETPHLQEPLSERGPIVLDSRLHLALHCVWDASLPLLGVVVELDALMTAMAKRMEMPETPALQSVPIVVRVMYLGCRLLAETTQALVKREDARSNSGP